MTALATTTVEPAIRTVGVTKKRGAQTVLDLRVDWRRVPCVNREESHLSDYTSSLVQVGQEKSRERVTPGCDKLAASPSS